MQTVQLQIDDSKLDTFLNLIDNLKDGIVQKLTILDDEQEYINSKQFLSDKEYFQNNLNDIESGKTETITHNEVWNQIDKHTHAS
jgi:hypothetical protein